MTWRLGGNDPQASGKLDSADAGGPGRGLRLCIPNKLPGDANGAGPWITLGVAKIY